MMIEWAVVPFQTHLSDVDFAASEHLKLGLRRRAGMVCGVRSGVLAVVSC